MVSKLKNFLQQYYQIYVDEIMDGYFSYQGNHYYLSRERQKRNILYQSYMNQLGLRGFKPVLNCFGLYESDGWILYRYQQEYYDVHDVLQLSLQPLQNKNIYLKDVKNRWCHLIDEARHRISRHASKLNHNEYYVVLSYYYQGIGETAITLLNDLLKRHRDATVFMGYEHLVFQNEYAMICNPDCFIFSSRSRDLANAYLSGTISIEQLHDYMIRYQMDYVELHYFFIRCLFPSQFFYLILEDKDEKRLKKEMIQCFQNVSFEKRQLIQLYELLRQYVYIPYIPWLMYEE